MSKRLTKEILSLAPHLREVDGYFFEPPSDHIMPGFVYETPPSGMYIWMFAHPLYDAASGLNLNFGQRLPRPDDFWELRRGEEGQAAAEFVRRVERHRDRVRSLGAPENFLNYVWTLGHEVGAAPGSVLSNPKCRRAYAATLIMLRRSDEAKEQLRLLLGSNVIDRYDDFRATIERWASLLESDVEEARSALLSDEAIERKRLGLE